LDPRRPQHPARRLRRAERPVAQARQERRPVHEGRRRRRCREHVRRRGAGGGGKKQALHNLWMMHAWTADAWQSSWGLFSAENPDLGGKIGDINGTPDAASKKQLSNTEVRE